MFNIIRQYYTGSIFFTILAVLAAGALGTYYVGGIAGALSFAFIAIVLGVLETSLSFDNAVVNATILKDMDNTWRHRFLTWGMIIAVFGMRVVFPLLIVGIAASIDPWSALIMAATDPAQYASILSSYSTQIEAFGGAFLAMVGLKFFFDHEKDVHWVGAIEKHLTKAGMIEGVELALVIAGLLVLSTFVPGAEQLAFLKAGAWGLITFVGVHGLGTIMEAQEETMHAAAKTGFASFLYLEVLDASFSFDGVIGAFALTNNLFLIALGLGIGAMFVRSMTIHLVDKGTLNEYKFLEHGAFWAIIALAAIMLIGPAGIHVPEVVTGFIGAVLIGLSFWSSVRENKKEEAASVNGTPAVPAE